MKTIQQTFVLMLLACIAVAPNPLKAQEKGNNNVLIEMRETPHFSGIEVDGAFDVEIIKGDTCQVRVETDENMQAKVKVYVEEGILHIGSTSRLKHPTQLKAYVQLPELKTLKVGGACDAWSTSEFVADELEVQANGASNVELDVNVQYLESKVSGAADLSYTGKATIHHLQVSGAGNLDAKDLVSEKANYTLSGAADAALHVSGEISGEKSGASSIVVTGNPEKKIGLSSKDNHEAYAVYADNYYDSVKVKVGGLKVEVFEGDDSVRIKVGDRELSVDDDGNIRLSRHKKSKFNGHWTGFDLGLNGFVNPDGNQSFPKSYEYLDLRMSKSVAANLNFFEQNVALSKNQKWGMVTGMGLTWNNYRFSHNVRLNSDSSELIGYVDKGVNLRKNKLTTFYINVPLIFEFQTNSRQRKNSFHIAAGMIAGARLSSHTKKYYDERNKSFEVTQYNAEADTYQTVYTATSPDHAIAKNFDDYFIQPFKFDATARIGWGFVNLYATYSINQMFKAGKGPELLYPWAIGITLTNL